MAERRMFAKSVIGSARFLRMPPSSRLLYYDLGMAADDDGVVEAFSVMRMTGAVKDDLKVLVSKGFVTVLNEDLVAYIVDWSRNNQIRKDRYQPSIYQNLLVQIGVVNQLETVGQPDGNQRLTQCSVGKGSKVKEKKADKPPRSPRFTPPTVDEVRTYCTERKNRVNPERFVDFYSANGWKQGKGKPIVDWKAAVRTWEREDKTKQSPTAEKPADWTREHPDWLDQSTWVCDVDGVYKPREACQGACV